MKLWKKLMKFGHFLGCHQMPERSFFINGYQFPVCARCTGVYIGALFAVVLFFVFRPNILLCIIFCIVMLLDWFLQHKMILSSTNCRRLITGSLAGYGLLSIELQVIAFLFEK